MSDEPEGAKERTPHGKKQSMVAGAAPIPELP